MKMRPVSYTMKNESSEVQKLSAAKTSATHIGFIAQEMEQIVPEAVAQNPDGLKLINYSAIIPILVQSVQELQATVETQEAKISELTQMLQVANASHNNITACYPNPTDGLVTVSVNLDEGAKSAKLTIATLSGIVEYEQSVNGSTPVEIDMRSFPSGAHVCSLIVDGSVCDSKRIVKD